jgi:hypothetical protein
MPWLYNQGYVTNIDADLFNQESQVSLWLGRLQPQWCAVDMKELAVQSETSSDFKDFAD